MSILGDLWVPITSHCSRKRPAQSLNLLHLPNRHLLKSRSSNRVVIKAQKSKKTRPKSTILSRPFKRIWKWKVTQVRKWQWFLQNWFILIFHLPHCSWRSLCQSSGRHLGQIAKGWRREKEQCEKVWSNRNKETNARQSVILNSFKRKRANDSSYRKTSFFLHHLSYLDYSLRSLLLQTTHHRHEKNSSDKNRSLHSSYLRNHLFKLMLFFIMREESPLKK